MQGLAHACGAPAGLHGVSGRKCMLTGKKANNGYTVSFSHKRDKHLQHANLQYKRVYWEREERWIRLRISTNAMKTIEKARAPPANAAAGRAWRIASAVPRPCAR
jgi:large subunit ribosomal protein L28